MKLWLVMAFALFFFSGCSFNTQKTKLQNKNAKQSLLIKQQQAQITALQKKLAKQKRKKRKTVRRNTLPNAPKKNIKLKKVEDNNYSSKYMYPDAKKRKKIPVVKVDDTANTSTSSTNTPTTSTNAIMNKAACIAMIGQAKFDKYTQMFGGEAGSIKRCKMLKSMR